MLMPQTKMDSRSIMPAAYPSKKRRNFHREWSPTGREVPRPKGHPGQRTPREEVEEDDMKWKDIGSGTIARSFMDVKGLFVAIKTVPSSSKPSRAPFGV